MSDIRKVFYFWNILHCSNSYIIENSRFSLEMPSKFVKSIAIKQIVWHHLFHLIIHAYSIYSSFLSYSHSPFSFKINFKNKLNYIPPNILKKFSDLCTLPYMLYTEAHRTSLGANYFYRLWLHWACNSNVAHDITTHSTYTSGLQSLQSGLHRRDWLVLVNPLVCLLLAGRLQINFLYVQIAPINTVVLIENEFTLYSATFWYFDGMSFDQVKIFF